MANKIHFSLLLVVPLKARRKTGGNSAAHPPLLTVAAHVTNFTANLGSSTSLS